MEQKKCSICKEPKDVTEFHKSSRLKDGLQSACKNCMNTAYNKSRKAKQQHYQEVANDRYARNTQRIRQWKSDRGCLVCGETYAQCLELHHIDPQEKNFDPSEGCNKSWETFLAEAVKCVVLCANCHRKVHGGVIVL
jgi:hypothetical protein